MNRKSLKIVVVAAAIASASVLSISSETLAAPISYSTSFEAPGFPLNSAVPSSPATLNGWFREDGTPTATALPDVNITNVHASPFAGGGAQSLRVLNKTPFNQGDLGSVTYVISPVATLPGAGDMIANNTPLVTISWDMRIDDGTNINTTSDTWGLDVYDSTANTRTLSVVRSALASVPGGTPDQAVIYGSGASGAINPVPKGGAAPSLTWAQYSVSMNYLTGLYTISVNGSVIGGDAMNLAGDDGLDINFVVNGRGNDLAYFDNFVVNAVPEPASLGMIAIATGAVVARRRR